MVFVRNKKPQNDDRKNKFRRSALKEMEVPRSGEVDPELLEPFPPHVTFSNPASYHIDGTSFAVGDLIWFEVDNNDVREGVEWGQAKVETVLPGRKYKLIGQCEENKVHVPNHPDLQAIPESALCRMWDGKKPECPLFSGTNQPMLNDRSKVPLSLEEAQAKYGSDLGFLGAKQIGLGPEMCGITLEQLKSILELPGFTETMTMWDVVQKFIKPATKGTGLSYALTLNKQKPLRATYMVSHGWMETYEHFIQALSATDLETEDAFWVCSMAIYQCEDIHELTIEQQLGSDVSRGPFATVLKQANVMLALLTPDSNIYTRMWCVLEIFMAIRLGVSVRLVSFREEESLYAYGSDVRVDDAAVKHGKLRCDSRSARCGDPSDPEMNSDERAIRNLIEQSDIGGYDTIDSVVEWVKAMYLIEQAEEIDFCRYTGSSSGHPILWGGYTSYNIKAKHYSAVANAIHRIHNKDALCMEKQ